MSVQEQQGTDVIQYEVVGPVATIWFNRPEVKNCVNWDLLMGLGQLLERAENDDDVRAAFPIAKEESRRGVIVVESLILGKDYRCLVIDGRIAAIAERVPASVTGDGNATVQQLVDTAKLIRKARVARIPRAGHYPWIEQPGFLNRMLRGLIAQL